MESNSPINDLDVSIAELITSTGRLTIDHIADVAQGEDNNE